MTKQGSLRVFVRICMLVLALSLMVAMPSYAKKAKSKELKFYTPNSGASGFVRFCLKPWVQKIEEGTEGKIKIRIYEMAALGSPRESYELIKAGGADLGNIVMGFFPGRFQLTNVMSLPFLGFSGSETASHVYWDLYEKFPEMRQQFPGVKVLFLFTDCSTVIGSRKPIRTLEDIKGMKIRALSGMPTEMLKAWGAAPLLLPPGEIYTAMERGTIDGWMISWEGVSGFRLQEITKHYCAAPFYNAQMAIIMNTNTWKKLPPDIRKVFEKHSGAAAVNAFGKGWDAAGNETREQIGKMKDRQIYVLPPDEVERWRKASRPVWDRWVANTDKAGLPGKEVLDEAEKLIKKYQQ